MEPALWVAIYAALVSTGVAYVQISTFLSNRPRLNFTLEEDYMAAGSDVDAGPLIVSLYVVNGSERPVAIREAGVILTDGREVAFTSDDEQRLLTEAAPASYWLERDALVGLMIEGGAGTRISMAYAKDYYTKTHRSKVDHDWTGFAASMVDRYGARSATSASKRTRVAPSPENDEAET